ncbi:MULTISPECIES: MarR family winged helix-turn-helix transcriptional regulator [unclassified Streptomyces]|uniref:MarR family winged helix-turn-helix transcriptional regulator n=1 Tax=unclassified Streptomyces TaxID=2593676 RepID=UPI0011E7C37B|nr:MarR family winged helix-turn-helix transcriptional regulator [Streptomyces sp. sk2.1]TXS61219.1 MarR family transcriptional regulator [Streptomyces sp. sk2.1]
MSQKSQPRRRALMAELTVESRRHMAAYALFNQAVADHLRLHPTDLQCINLLGLEAAPVTTGRIAELTGLTTGSATRLVDRLERGGYVTRERDTVDRRRVLVAPVPERMAEVGAVWERLSGAWAEMFEAYDDDEMALLIAHMRRTIELSARQVEVLRRGTAAPDPACGGDPAEPGTAAADPESGADPACGGVRRCPQE